MSLIQYSLETNKFLQGISASDPCNACPLPLAFTPGDANLCQNEQNDTSFEPTLSRYSYGAACYLQIIDCPAYDIITNSQCIGILQKALRCVNDPCNNCSLPGGAFSFRDDLFCNNAGSDDTYAPTYIRYPLGDRCYLQMMDCPAYDLLSGNECIGILPPQQAVECIDGKFRAPGRTVGFPIDKIRCNPNAFITSLRKNVTISDCPVPAILSPTDTTFCGNASVGGIDWRRTTNGTHVLLTLRNCISFNLITGYDGTGSCRTEKSITGICENGRFKLNGREIYKMRCAPPPPLSECEKGNWQYSWMTDSYFKLGYNRTVEEAKIACIEDVMSYMERKEASIGEGIYIWIGVDKGPDGLHRNIDGTPLDYTYWSAGGASGDGYCVRIKTIDKVDLPGQWNDLDCSYTSQAYVCRKTPQPTG